MEPQAFEKMRKKIYNKDKTVAGLYDMEETIGAGHFAQVKLARHVFSGAKVAIKVIDKTKLDDVAKSHLHKEVSCMKLVQHPNVVRMYQVIDTQSKLYLILEYGDGGDLYDHIMTYEGLDRGMTEEKARHYFKQIVSAIDYCHKLHVVHRDLKPENVILFRKGNKDLAKLTDFGFSNLFTPEKKLDTSCGSLAYSAPEILLGDSYDPTAVDVWSLGVILYMMVNGRGPFNHASDSETLTNIMECSYDLPSVLSNDCKRLIKRMLVRKPGERASMKSILEDGWVQQGPPIDIPHNPLISEVDLSVDVHLDVLQAMSKEWTKEQIETSLRDDQYGSVTATYYLLAERIVKRRHANNIPHTKISARHSSPFEKGSSVNELDPTNELKYEVENDRSIPITSDLTSEHSQSDEHIESIADDSQEFVPKPLSSRSNRMSYPFPTRTTKSSSSPNLLQGGHTIMEENESEAEESPRNSPHVQKKPPVRRTTFNTCRLSPIHSRRSSSSDDDDSHYILEQRILTHSTSSPSNMVSSGTTPNTTESPSSNTNKTKSTSSDNLNAKMLSLLIDEFEQNLISSKASSRVMLTNLVNNAYGRHLSDTNLTTYSLQLQLALATEKIKTYRSPHHQSKSNSDTNLVKKFCKKKHHLMSADIFKTKELIFKYLKRSKIGNKASSPLSLSAPIQEEDPIINPPSLSESINTCSLSQTFSDIIQDQAGCDLKNDGPPYSPKSDITSSVKYYPKVADDDCSFTGNTGNMGNIDQDSDFLGTVAVKPSSVVAANLNNYVTANGSVCCSLV